LFHWARWPGLYARGWGLSKARCIATSQLKRIATGKPALGFAVTLGLAVARDNRWLFHQRLD
jgi:hypothetical protein